MRKEFRYKVTLEADTAEAAQEAAELIANYMDAVFTEAETVGWKVTKWKLVGKGKNSEEAEDTSHSGLIIAPAGSIGTGS